MIHYITSDGLGQPWVGNELRVVTGAGIPVTLHAIRSPSRIHFDSAWAREMAERTRALYPLPPAALAVAVLSAPLVHGRRWWAAALNALFAPRENLRARVSALAHFLVACHWARTLRREPVAHIHSQWAYSSASIGMYGAWLLGVPFSFTGHAADLFRDRVALRDKIRRAKFIVCISEFHRAFFLENGARPDQLRLAYCGIDVEQMTPRTDGRAPGPFTILSSGRLVEKKGFEYLIDACGVLRDRGVEFRCVVAGSGPLERSLRARISGRGLDDRVTVTGKPLLQDEIPAFMHHGDLYVLACVWARDRDVDGLPQMTMEAMGCGLPAVTTRLVGNPDLVVHEQTGLLVEPNDAVALADAIERLIKDPALAERLGRAGRAWVLERFDIRTSLASLIAEYAKALGAARLPSHTTSSAVADINTPGRPAAQSAAE